MTRMFSLNRLTHCLVVLFIFVIALMESKNHHLHHNDSNSQSSKRNVGLLSSMIHSGADGDLLSGISRKSLKEKKHAHHNQLLTQDIHTHNDNNGNASTSDTEVATTSINSSSLQQDNDNSLKSMKKFNIFDTSLSTLTSPSKEESEQLFFMYDLHEKFWWRWPHNDTEKECQENGYLSHAHAEYSAIGRPIIPEDGLFLTWHFSMFNSLFNRFKRSPRRTKDPEKASMFIIPYDLGLDGYSNPRNCANRRQCTEGLVGKLMEILNSMPYFARHQGADHVVLWSLGQYHPWPRAGCDLFMRSTCEKCTLSCYWMDHTKPENRFVSMPFPAAYHYWDGIQRLPWDTSPKAVEQRNLTAVYLGSTLTLNPWHTKIRRAMAAQCNTSSDCHWLKIAHSSIDNSIGDLLSVYKKATFCLCPPGDDPARKAVFDAIVSGCIPVIFEVATLYNQYPWHIGEDAALDISVYIPGGAMRSGKIQFMDILRNIPPEVIRKKQWAIAQVAPRIQYSIPPYHLLADKFDESLWVPPFHDAAELALDGFFQRTQRMLRNESTHIPHRLLSGREWGADYDEVKVQVPGEVVFFGEEINALPLSQRAQFKEVYYARMKENSGNSDSSSSNINNNVNKNDNINPELAIDATHLRSNTMHEAEAAVAAGEGGGIVHGKRHHGHKNGPGKRGGRQQH